MSAFFFFFSLLFFLSFFPLFLSPSGWLAARSSAAGERGPSPAAGMQEQEHLLSGQAMAEGGFGPILGWELGTERLWVKD